MAAKKKVEKKKKKPALPVLPPETCESCRFFLADVPSMVVDADAVRAAFGLKTAGVSADDGAFEDDDAFEDDGAFEPEQADSEADSVSDAFSDGVFENPAADGPLFGLTDDTYDEGDRDPYLRVNDITDIAHLIVDKAELRRKAADLDKRSGGLQAAADAEMACVRRAIEERDAPIMWDDEKRQQHGVRIEKRRIEAHQMRLHHDRAGLISRVEGQENVYELSTVVWPPAKASAFERIIGENSARRALSAHWRMLRALDSLLRPGPGLCRRHAPQIPPIVTEDMGIFGAHAEHSTQRFPEVVSDEWCGEFVRRTR